METLNIKVKGEQIQEKEYTKYLQVLIDNKLSWNCHVKHVNLKMSNGIGILTKLRRYLSKGVHRTLFYAFVQPHMDYGLLVWGNATPSNLKPIKKKLQKTVMKILFKNRNQPIELLFHELKVLDFDKHEFLIISSFMWQLTYDNIPDTNACFKPGKPLSSGLESLKAAIAEAAKELFDLFTELDIENDPDFVTGSDRKEDEDVNKE